MGKGWVILLSFYRDRSNMYIRNGSGPEEIESKPMTESRYACCPSFESKTPYLRLCLPLDTNAQTVWPLPPPSGLQRVTTIFFQSIKNIL
jgi:hypothetical protein